MKIAMETAEEFLTLPEDALIQVSVADVTTRDVPGRDGREGWTSMSFKFNIIGMPSHLEGKYGVLLGSTIYGSVGARLTTHPDNKLRKWTEALLDLGELGEGFELDTDQLIGRKARAQIGNYTKKDSTQLNHKVIGLLPFTPTDITQNREPAFAGFGSDEPPF